MTLSSRNRNSIAEFQQGSYSAVKELYNEHYAPLVDFATQLTMHKAEAHSIVLETLIKLFLMRERFDKDPDIKAFLYITVRNICFTFIKSDREEEVSPVDVPWLAPSMITTARMEEMALREATLITMHQMVGALPQAEQAVFKTLFYSRLSVQTTAELLKQTPVTIAQRRIQAIRLLRDGLIAAELYSIPLFIYFVAVFCGEQNA